MGFLTRIFNREPTTTQPAEAAEEKRLAIGLNVIPTSGPGSWVPMTVGFVNSAPSDAGVNVTELTALQSSAVFACVSVISDAIAQLPCHVVSRKDTTKHVEHPLHRLINDNPNPYQTGTVFKSTIMANALLYGGGYAWIEKDAAGQPVGLYPLRSEVTRPLRINGDLVYYTILGTTVHWLRPDEVFFVPFMTLDGITPIGPISQGKQAVGLEQAATKYGATYFKNGGNIGGIIEVPAGMTEEQTLNFKASWKRSNEGLDNAHKIAALPGGMKYHQTGKTPEESQYLDVRNFQVREIARFFRVPLHLIGDLERSTNNNIEQQSLEFALYTVQPWAIKLEAEAERKLLLESEKPQLEIKFDLDAILRADTASRYEAYTQGRQGGWLSINDIRRKEGLPPVDGGDVLLQPLNMTPVNPANPTAPAPTVTPATTPPADGADESRATVQLLEEAGSRILRKEANAIRRAAKKYAGNFAGFTEFAESFYKNDSPHEQLVTRAMSTPLAAAGSTTTAAAYARSHTATSLTQVMEANEAGPDALDNLLDEWDSIRPHAIAEALTAKA